MDYDLDSLIQFFGDKLGMKHRVPLTGPALAVKPEAPSAYLDMGHLAPVPGFPIGVQNAVGNDKAAQMAQQLTNRDPESPPASEQDWQDMLFGPDSQSGWLHNAAAEQPPLLGQISPAAAAMKRGR